MDRRHCLAGDKHSSHHGAYCKSVHMYRSSVDRGPIGSPKRSLEAMRADAASMVACRIKLASSAVVKCVKCGACDLMLHM